MKSFRFRIMGLLACIATVLSSCSNENPAASIDENSSKINGEGMSFVAGSPATRTSLNYDTGAFFWEAGDKIYVKDDDGIWQASKNSVDKHTPTFTFKVPGKFTKSTTYKVYYSGKNGINNQVTIPDIQSQDAPNITTHLGISGDCGTADAVKTVGGNSFKFNINHQAAILVFQPYTTNTILNKCYLTKIEVTSDNNITGTYTLDSITGKLTENGSGTQINLNTINKETSPNGFPLSNSVASVSTNGAYMVIKPGAHALKVRYWVKDYVSKAEGTITKTYPSFDYKGNSYYDMTANLKVQDYSAPVYYMWDAQKNYWYNYEFDSSNPQQPTLNDASSNYYPKDKTSDPLRWYNDSYPGYGIRNDAQTDLFKTIPNINEMAWYVIKGDAHWDDEVWTSMGHLWKGGAWIKKRAKIAADNNVTYETMASVSPEGRDWRLGSVAKSYPISSATLSDDEKKDYFFLPAFGQCYLGKLSYVGQYGYYWSSSAHPTYSLHALNMSFTNSLIAIHSTFRRNYGFIAQPFEALSEDSNISPYGGS